MDSSLLEQFTNPTNPVAGLNDKLNTVITFVTIFSIVITLLCFVLWIVSWIQRRKVQKAILQMRDVLVEMNERDKERTRPVATFSPSTTNLFHPIKTIYSP